MTSSIRSQIEGLRILAERVSPRQLMKSGAIARESEARHLIDMMKDAAETLDRNEGVLR